MGKIRIGALILISVLGTTQCKEKDDNLFWLLANQLNGSGSGTEESGGNGEGTGSEGSGAATEETADKTGEGKFTFNTTKDVGLNVTVKDPSGNVTGALVQILLTDGEVIFQSLTAETGLSSGLFTINTTVTAVILKISSGDQIHTSEVDTTNLLELVRTVTLAGTATATQPDADGDGIPDIEDAYPEDDDRAAKVEHPSSGISIVAFEDLYPNKGDADFNDYVVRLSNEEDLDASGKTVRVRGSYQHIAKGAGYWHTLNLNLSTGGATVTRKIYSAAGTLESEMTTHVDQAQNVEILGKSSTTISQSNVSSSQTFQPGKKAEIEIVFDQPQARAEIGSFPYDLFIRINGSQEVHFPGKFTKPDGTDLYLDSDGFPWAIQIPEAWNWPLESKKVWDGYPDFTTWYQSAGANKADWYLNASQSYLFSFISQAGLSASIVKGYGNVILLVSLALLGGLGFIVFSQMKKARARAN